MDADVVVCVDSLGIVVVRLTPIDLVLFSVEYVMDDVEIVLFCALSVEAGGYVAVKALSVEVFMETLFF